jgi:hypothetical protein
MRQKPEETIAVFLHRLLVLALQPPFYDHGKYAALSERVDDMQQLIRNMFPSLHHEVRRAMAMNLAVGVTYWEWTNELIADLLPDGGLNPFGFPSETDAQLSLVYRLGTVISEWDVAMERFDGRPILLAGYTVNPDHRRFQGVVPNIGSAKCWHQIIATKFTNSTNVHGNNNGGDDNDDDDDNDSDGDDDGDDDDADDDDDDASDGDEKRRGKRPRLSQ